jgi:hypothetical protein
VFAMNILKMIMIYILVNFINKEVYYQFILVLELLIMERVKKYYSNISGNANKILSDSIYVSDLFCRISYVRFINSKEFGIRILIK